MWIFLNSKTIAISVIRCICQLNKNRKSEPNDNFTQRPGLTCLTRLNAVGNGMGRRKFSLSLTVLSEASMKKVTSERTKNLEVTFLFFIYLSQFLLSNRNSGPKIPSEWCCYLSALGALQNQEVILKYHPYVKLQQALTCTAFDLTEYLN